ncbi:renalase-like [Adelges cooleyi]|uniref:renalase-like n=1 Tax=Adelges cooleyi TaxID=133065 RepID=UPI00217FE768|nr:renalase-like [Adelges cooleyi]
MKVLLVGCGLTSTITAYLLRTRSSNVHLTLWDKARGPGGRTSVRRGPNGTFVDLGAQFITTDEWTLKKYSDIYNLLISTKHLVPMTCNVEGLQEVQGEQHFIAPNGTNSLVKHLLDNAKVDSIVFERRVSSILPSGNVKCTDGFEQIFDLIILTVPAPQLLELECPIISSVINPYNNTPGCVVLNSESIPILGGGDSFTKSTFNGWNNLLCI